MDGSEPLTSRPAIAAALWRALAAAEDAAAQPEVAAAWDAPSALEGLTVGGLVAHLLIATERTAVVLEDDAPSPDGVRVVGLAEFYGPNRVAEPSELDEGLPALLRQGAAAKAAEGATTVVASLACLAARLRPLVEAAADDRLVPVVQVRGGGAPLDDYLVTRIIELVVHTDDLACSVGLTLPEIPADVQAIVTAAFVELAVARSGSRAVLRAFARRERADADVLRVL